jgi:hypothetical protein
MSFDANNVGIGTQAQKMKDVLLAATFASAFLAQLSDPSIAQTPAEAYIKGCAGCHSSERTVLRSIPKGPESERRAWIEKFMTQHPCERDDLKHLIATYLLEKSAR